MTLQNDKFQSTDQYVTDPFVGRNVEHSGNDLKTGDEKTFVQTPESLRSKKSRILRI